MKPNTQPDNISNPMGNPVGNPVGNSPSPRRGSSDDGSDRHSLPVQDTPYAGFPAFDEQSLNEEFMEIKGEEPFIAGNPIPLSPRTSPKTAQGKTTSSGRVQIQNTPMLQEHRKNMAIQRSRSRRDSNISESSSNRSFIQNFSFQSRRRGFSRSSNRSVHSNRSTSPSRPRSMVTDDAQNTNGDEESLKSVGETDEDVCFPMYEPEDESRNVKITELDQLLNNLSDSEAAAEDPVTAPGSDETYVDDKRYDNVISPSQLEVPFIPSKHTMKKLELPPAEQPLGDMSQSENAYTPANFPTTNHRISNAAQDEIFEQQRFSFFATKMESTIHAPDLASLVGENESFSSLFDSKNGIWWLDCYDPTDMEMKIISRAFGIHPLTAEDIRTEESREKFELFKNYYFVSFHTFESDPAQEDTYLEPINFYMIVYADGVLSFHFTQVDHCRNVRRRMRQLRDYVAVTSDWVCYALIDDIVDSFAPVIHEIEGEADEIEDLVYVNTGNHAMSQTLARLVIARRKTMSMIRLLSTKADVIKMFAKRCNEHWKNMPGGEIALFLGDIQDHIVTMYQNLSAYEKIFSRSHVNYMAQLQVEFVNSSNRMTDVLGKATLVGTILVPMNLITGLFGMNVQVPGQNVENLHWFFSILGIIVFLIAFFGIAANFYVKRMRDSSQV